MGNTISNCCQAPLGENSAHGGHIVHHSGKSNYAVAARTQAKRKSVHFMDSKKSMNAINLSKSKVGLQPNLNWEIDAAGSPDEMGDCSKSSVTIMSDSEDYRSFIFDKQIGDGKFGTVFLAHPRSDPKSNVAIKVIPQKVFSHRIEQELHLLKTIDHPNIVNFVSSFKDKSSKQANFYIVTEYWEGGEMFRKIVDQGGIDELEACGIMAQILSAVSFLHERSICHRDLKPENILFSEKGGSKVKLIDFGLSKQLKEGERMKKKLGTPYYLAPEILEEDYGIEVDMWSLGVVAYVLLWGYPPFYGKDARELFINIYNVNFEFCDDDWDFISEEAKDFIRRLLVKDPKVRMTAKEALNHPWIRSCDKEDSNVELNSSISETRCSPRQKLEAVLDNMMSKSVDLTTFDSYEKWLQNYADSFGEDE